MSKRPVKRSSGKQTDALLGDLENIRTLLSEGEQALSEGEQALSEGEQALSAEEHEAATEINVPLLEDVIDGGMVVDETFLTDTTAFAPESEEFPGLDEKMIKALMGDEWRETTRKIMAEARQKIQDDWAPDADDDLNEALRVRMDATVERWLHKLVADNIAELRTQLVGALAEELRHLLDDGNEGDSGR